MKKHHIPLVLLLIGIAAYFLNETRNLKGLESIARDELRMLRDAVKKIPRAATASTLAGKNSRPPAIDSTQFTAELSAILKGGPGEVSQKRMQEFLTVHGPQLNSAPLSILKEICELLEKDLAPDQASSEAARFVWQGVVGLAAKSDPAWAIAKLDQAVTTAEAPIDSLLGIFKQLPTQNGGTMSLAYAGALQKWLDAAEAGGRIEEGNPLVAELRSQIASAQGNRPAVVKQMSQLPWLKQGEAARSYAKGLQTPAARKQAMEELSTALHIQNFSHFVNALAAEQGFEAAREILDSAVLTPEKHDLAAASIAAANIGPDTPAKATWLLESLRSDDKRAIIEFTEQWTYSDYPGTAQWLSSLPAGRQRDTAISGFAPIAAKIDGATAVDWALALTDPNERRSCVDDVVRKWREIDAEAATAYLKEKGLPVK